MKPCWAGRGIWNSRTFSCNWPRRRSTTGKGCGSSISSWSQPGRRRLPVRTRAASETLEGGFNLKEFLAANEAHLDTVPQVLDLAMMLETQALDLYLRFADRCAQTAAKTILFAIADEEKVHLARLGRLLEEKSTAKGMFAWQLP